MNIEFSVNITDKTPITYKPYRVSESVFEDKFEFNSQRQKPKILTELMSMLTEQC